MSEPSQTMQAWSHLLSDPALAEFFDGVFEHIGIRVQETGEAFTVHHHGDRFSFTEGVESREVDFEVDLKQENVDNLVRHAEDGKIDPDEALRIVSVLFTPMTRASLQNPYLTRSLLLRLGGVGSLIHVHLLDAQGSSVETHSLIFARNGQWVVVPGLHGDPERAFRINAEQAIDYQRRLFQAAKKNSFAAWWRFIGWYKDWRRGVSVAA